MLKFSKELFFKDFPDTIVFNDQTYQNTLGKDTSENIRLGMGRWLTTEQYEKRREEILNKPLP